MCIGIEHRSSKWLTFNPIGLNSFLESDCAAVHFICHNQSDQTHRTTTIAALKSHWFLLAQALFHCYYCCIWRVVFAFCTKSKQLMLLFQFNATVEMECFLTSLTWRFSEMHLTFNLFVQTDWNVLHWTLLLFPVRAHHFFFFFSFELNPDKRLWSWLINSVH